MFWLLLRRSRDPPYLLSFLVECFFLVLHPAIYHLLFVYMNALEVEFYEVA